MYMLFAQCSRHEEIRRSETGHPHNKTLNVKLTIHTIYQHGRFVI